MVLSKLLTVVFSVICLMCLILFVTEFFIVDKPNTTLSIVGLVGFIFSLVLARILSPKKWLVEKEISDSEDERAPEKAMYGLDTYENIIKYGCKRH